MKVYGVDFTSAPRRAKAITVASGSFSKGIFSLEDIESLASFAQFEAFLARPGPWVGGFDFPFSLPRELMRDLGWPVEWPALVMHCASMDRLAFRAALDAYRNTRAVGSKYAHRATDLPAGSSSPMKLVNPPVALMFHEGARRLLAAALDIPALHSGSSSRVALEAYPGLLVRGQLGLRASYKSDTRRDHTPARKAVRRQVVQALQKAKPLGIALRLERPLERLLVEDGSGDSLDAAICALQAAWGYARRRSNYGLPAGTDPLEGWIVSS